MKPAKLVAGIDVSKDSLDIYYNTPDGKEHYFKTSNCPNGHLHIVKKLGVARTCVLEASGTYYVKLAITLSNSGIEVLVENPIAVKRFIQMQLERNKSDKKDARWLFRYGMERKLIKWTRPTTQKFKCAQIIASINLFTRQITQITNQLHALDQLPVVDRSLMKILKRVRNVLQNKIVRLELLLHLHLDKWKGEQVKSIISIPGLGKRAVALLIVYTDGFTKIKNYRQLIALAGLVPREHTSGSSVRGKKGICKMGNRQLRNVLYMCSLSAIEHNKACRELYQRLRQRGKRGNVALIAVCNKLLKQAYAIATKGTLYQADYVSKNPNLS